MPIYTYRCGKDHETDSFFKIDEKPDYIYCPHCSRVARSIINCVKRNGCWPEGRVFENVGDTPKVFKSYSEMDRYLHKNSLSVETLSPAQLKVRREERRHNGAGGRGQKVAKVRKVPEKIDRAFRESPTVETAIRALKEDRV